MVGPVGVHHPHLGDRGVTLLLISEIGLEEFQVVQIHGKTHAVQQVLQSALLQGRKALDHRHRGRRLMGADQGVRLLRRGLPALHGVDDIAADLVQVRLAERPLQHIDLGIGHQGALHIRQQLDALGAGVSALVKLTGQGLHRQDAVGRLGLREGLVIEHVHLGLGEHHPLGPVIDRLVDLIHVVAVEDPHARQALDPQETPQIAEKALRLGAEARLFLYIYTIDHQRFPPFPAASARCPISRRQ